MHLRGRSLKGIKGYAVTAGQESVINVFNLATPKDDPDFCLLGHLDNVCTNIPKDPGGPYKQHIAVSVGGPMS